MEADAWNYILSTTITVVILTLGRKLGVRRRRRERKERREQIDAHWAKLEEDRERARAENHPAHLGRPDDDAS